MYQAILNGTFFILYPELQDERGTELHDRVAKILEARTTLLSMRIIYQIRKQNELESIHAI